MISFILVQLHFDASILIASEFERAPLRLPVGLQQSTPPIPVVAFFWLGIQKSLYQYMSRRRQSNTVKDFIQDGDVLLHAQIFQSKDGNIQVIDKATATYVRENVGSVVSYLGKYL